ncbi:LamG-like jellyroll fold domain-containing protein [Hymenobacter jeollabukensis]|nr:LamG-like jellyroll fold domain-containing protein [Hymenobacter jeollabukensis]
MKHAYSSSQPASITGFLPSSLRGAVLAGLLGLGLPAAAQSPSALTLNGSSSYVQANTVTLNGTALTMECWVRVSAFKASSPFISSVMGVEDGNNAAMLRFGDVGIGSNKLQFVLTVGTTQRKLNSVTSFNTNTWYHVAGTFDGSTMRLYVNGVLDGSASGTAGSMAGTGVFCLGRNYESVRVLNGTVDEARVWTRALTATELAASPCSVSASATGLEAYWKLDEGTGTVAADASGRGHGGTLIGTTNASWTTAIPTQCVTTAVNTGRKLDGLQVQVLGNPVHGSQATIEVRGTQGQPATVQVFNMLGALVQRLTLKPTTDAQQSRLTLPGAAGLYVVRVSTPAGTATTRLIKQ